MNSNQEATFYSPQPKKQSYNLETIYKTTIVNPFKIDKPVSKETEFSNFKSASKKY